MADITDVPPLDTEEDPAAEFLAREQDQLAGLEDDNCAEEQTHDADFDPFGGSEPQVHPMPVEDDDYSVPQMSGGNLFDDLPVTDDIGGGSASQIAGTDVDFLSGASSNLAQDDFFGGGGLSSQPSVQSAKPFMAVDAPESSSTGDGTAVDLFDSGTAEQDVLVTEPLVTVAPATSPLPTLTNGPTDAYAAIAHVDRQREEPEQVKIWREEQKARLETKDSEEEVKISEWREAAKKEIEDWYKHYHEQREKTRENNQTAEQSFIEQRDDVSEGKEWEKICGLCEFNPKSSKITKDVSRMRSVLLQLKQTPLIRN